MNAAKECDADEMEAVSVNCDIYEAQVKDSGGLESDSMNVRVS